MAPSMPPSPPLRLVRAAVFSAVCVILTSLGHLVASGQPMAPWAIGLGFAGVLGFALVLAGHERSLATITGGLLLGQFALHALFVAGHAHHAGHQAVVQDGGTGPEMMAVHLLAAVASAWWLRRGERRAWWLARLAAHLLAVPFSLVFSVLGPPVRGVAAAPPAPPIAPPVSNVLRYVLVLRGPPVRSPALGCG
ncbi:MFS transporter [Actinomadura craniellae]|uniref:MFS transporter n=1 Tax=Actinomadura craniellae TaxID=2231787 RepID=A0A365HFA1_9ACTN|nr:MFS transporter [Actinomadura craniellae]RAY16833.1 MFS transporter [Actinomadura craniellae]